MVKAGHVAMLSLTDVSQCLFQLLYPACEGGNLPPLVPHNGHCMGKKKKRVCYMAKMMHVEGGSLCGIQIFACIHARR